MACVAGIPAAMMSGIAATARLARLEKSTLASTQILPPMTAIRPKRYISMPPCTLTGMLRTRAPKIGMKPSRIAKIAATTKTMIEKTRVMGITRVFSIMVFVVAAIFAILLGFIPIFGALVRSIPVSVQGGIEMYLFGLIAVIGGKIWVDAKVDFSKRANLAVAAIPLIIAAGIPATQAIPIHLGSLTLTFNNLGLGALSAIVLYQLLRPGHVRDQEKEPAEVVAPG